MNMAPLYHLYWAIPVGYIVYAYVKDTYHTWKSAKQHPIAGELSPLIPRPILNLIYALRAAHLCQYTYKKFKDRAVQFIRSDGNVLVLPPNTLNELSTLPATVASPHDGLENELMGRYTSISLILDSRLHHSIVQRRLTPRLPVLVPFLESSLSSAFRDCFPQCDDWVDMAPHEVFGKISARANAPALVGPAFSKDPEWLDIAFNYTEQLMQTMVLLRMLPRSIQPFAAPLLPSYWKGRRCVQKAQDILYPKIQQLMEANDKGLWDPESSTKEEDMNVLSWLAGSIKGSERNPASIVHVEVLLAFASTHTSLTRVVNCLYDIMEADPGLTNELLAEIETVAVNAKGWNDVPYDRLHKLDSVLRESQRTSPTALLGMKRLFKEPYTFKNGLHVPAGTFTTMMVASVENDPDNTPNPEVFDGLRFYREKVALVLDNPAARDLDFTAATKTALGFGYGRTACPGRFFASLVLKMVFVKLLTEFEFKFLEGEKRPEPFGLHDFLITDPKKRILVRRRRGGVCPF
ncbi:cytochrome P450 [Xylariaceae sp. FL1272]|nr:cytochrome P450 [Xylariaceae sp. FL1272]